MKESQKNKAILAQVKAKALTNAEFRKKLLANATEVLRKAGAIFGKDVDVKVVENTEKIRHLVLPFIAAGTLSDDALAAIAAGDSTATSANVVQTTLAVSTESEAVETTTTEQAEAETTVVAVAEIVAT